MVTTRNITTACMVISSDNTTGLIGTRTVDRINGIN